MRKMCGRVLAGVLVTGLVLTGCGGGKEPSGGGTAGTETAGADGTGAVSGGSGAGNGSGSVGMDTTGFLMDVLNADIQTADVQKTTKDYTVPTNIFDRLADIQVDDQGVSKIVPSLAEKWDISGDGLEYTFYLQKGVKFQNGNDFTAEDVLYTFERLLTVEGGLNTELLDQVKGAAELMEGTADTLEGVEVVDDYTVKITLKEPFAAFLSCLTAPGLSIYDSEATEAAGDQFGMDPAVTVGTGPFKFAGWNFNDQLVLVKNDDYWRGAPELPGVVIKIIPDTETQTMMFESGELDLLDLDFVTDAADRFLETYPDQIVQGPRVGITYFTMNFNKEPFQDVKVRQAVQMAIDRQAILDALYGGRGQVEHGIYPYGLIGFNEGKTKISYDPEGAKALLEEDGYGSGFNKELAEDASTSDNFNMAMEIIKTMI